MAAGNFILFNSAKAYFFDGTFDWDTDAHYCELFKAAFDEAVTHDIWSDGGTATATGDCDATTDTSFGTNVTLTARYAIIRTGTASPATSNKLVGFVELDTGTDVSSTNGTFEIQWNASGLWTFA